MTHQAVGIFQHIHGYVYTRALISACNMKVFDILAFGKQTAEEISQVMETDFSATQDLLNMLVLMGYVQKGVQEDSASPNDGYTNSELSCKYLTSSSPYSLIPVVELTDQMIFQLARYLTSAIREGKSQVERTFGESVFLSEMLVIDREKCEGFIMAMHSFRKVFVCDPAQQLFELNSHRLACDFGGGTGVIAYSLADTYPSMQFVVYDLPAVVEVVEKFRNQGSMRTKSSVCFQGGDPLRDPLPRVDLFILSNTVNIWPGDLFANVLNRIFEALQPGGAVLILEPVPGDEKPTQIHSLMFSLVSLISVGSKCRSFEEYRELLDKHGFVNIMLKRSASLCDAIMATKPITNT
ncbi:putative bifunctional dTTP/UTP pyrophosphatase/methyltransferase protein [Saccoglossus kowalevskii]|uniref:Acetylserotonin O-methyltransferase n=1 Tax=Saccoglossus kowalevskii TaxID=10224 RepID=A0ABM0MVM7_SACKO|nr:PREDICTED: N-acetylserotonin O-methyltransferase-like protein-like [Saccoglossus kowalevskii]